MLETDLPCHARFHLMVLLALLPLLACFMVEKWSGKEIAWLNLSESQAVIAGKLGLESWNWNNLSDSAGTVFLSPEMNPIRCSAAFFPPSVVLKRHPTDILATACD